MPLEAFYVNMTLPDKLEKLAGHHHETGNRHISSFEHDFLLEAAERIREDEKIFARIGKALKAQAKAS
jgi:hypothetical protein